MTVSQISDRARFEAEGILFPLPAFTSDEVAAARAAFNRIAALPPEIGRRILLSKSHLVSRTLWDLLFARAVLDRVSAIAGPDLLVWGANFFSKPPGSAQFVSWHQDATYWGLEPDDIVTAWIALTPSTVENGCMRVIKGSHDSPLPHVDTHAADNMLSRGQEIAVAVDEAQATDVVLAPGQMSLHHVRIAHGSEPNRSDDWRIGWVVRYIGGHVRPTAGRRDRALLVLGTDRGHFEAETPPSGELLPEDLARHALI